MTSYHEPVEQLSEHARNCTRAINSLKEELEAVDWYNQRVEASQDESLKKILAHNRDEEMEHACMVLEWLRRNMGGWDEQLRMYLFSEGDVTELEEAGGEGEGLMPGARGKDLGIGKLK
ncbi:MAG: hypothetical protein JXB25_00505 [Deltaproteobacteria bacterium]|nr:hypothetical protein [Deltaproteobacteria bacterium]